VRDALREKIVTSLCVSAFLAFTLLFFGPTHLYFTNILECSSSAWEVTPLFFVLSLCCTLLLTILLALLRTPIYQRAISFFLFLSFLLWLQGNLLVWDYGLLDGRSIDWDANRVYGLVDNAIWIALLILAVAAAGHTWRIARRASVVFLVVQLFSTAVVAIQTPDAFHPHKELIEDKESIFEFSAEKNVMILVLDTFQGDIFQEIIKENPEYKDLFDGFTYYRNALGGFPTTYGSVALILTGRYYENSVPI